MLARSVLPLSIFLVMLFAACELPGDDDLTAQMLERHPADTAQIIAEPPVNPVVDYAVDYGGGHAGHFAEPEQPDSIAEVLGVDELAGVVVVHEWWGLDGTMEAAANRLAGEGFRVLAVDLYDGFHADAAAQAEQLLRGALEDPGALVRNMQHGVAYLQEQHGAQSIGTLGWSFGGTQALNLALTGYGALEAAVLYYPAVQNADRSDLEHLNIPILAFFGADDDRVSEQHARDFEDTLSDLGKEADVRVYSGVGHGFANPGAFGYDQEAAQRAWRETVDFFYQHLYGVTRGEIERRAAALVDEEDPAVNGAMPDED